MFEDTANTEIESGTAMTVATTATSAESQFLRSVELPRSLG